jgi:SH3 domain-containing YSC84-like protein 1
MNLRPILAVPILISVTVASAYPALATRVGAIDTVQSSTKLFTTIMSSSKLKIPEDVLQKAQGMAIIPNLARGGFIVGGSRGKGILVLRNADGSWSNPVFLTLTSGSIGLQAGGESSDVVLVFRNKGSIDTVLTNEFTLGGSVSVAAGPVGGDVVSPTDDQIDTDIYSYALNKGLFAGISLEGAKIGTDRGRNEDYYGQRHITVQQILTNPKLPSAPETAELHRVLTKFVPPVSK